ncbi:MAG: hypothetical protein IJ751_02355 [Oscillospiraceae bacterium]|nr:hypothetical protein [Oscillospiraceae bacterium]
MKWKKNLALLLCALMALGLLTSCTGHALENREQEQAIAILNGESARSYSLSTGTTLEGQTLYNADDIVVQLAGITGDPEDFTLELAVRNGSRRDISISLDRIRVDGWERTGWSDLYQVDSHSVALGGIRCEANIPEWYTPEDVGEIELKLSIFDADDYSSYADSLTYTLVTSAGPQANTSPEGELLLEEAGLSVSLLDLYCSDYDAELYFYIRNESGHDVYCEAEDAALNGQRCDLWFYERIGADGYDIFEATLYPSFDEDEGYDSHDDYVFYDENIDYAEEPLWDSGWTFSPQPGDEIAFTLTFYDNGSDQVLLSQPITITVPADGAAE